MRENSNRVFFMRANESQTFQIALKKFVIMRFYSSNTGKIHILQKTFVKQYL